MQDATSIVNLKNMKITKSHIKELSYQMKGNWIEQAKRIKTKYRLLTEEESKKMVFNHWDEQLMHVQLKIMKRKDDGLAKMEINREP